jgi:hypothetical protein
MNTKVDSLSIYISTLELKLVRQEMMIIGLKLFQIGAYAVRLYPSRQLGKVNELFV